MISGINNPYGENIVTDLAMISQTISVEITKINERGGESVVTVLKQFYVY